MKTSIYQWCKKKKSY